MRLVFTVALAGLILSGCSKSNEGGNYLHVKEDDAAMEAAVEKAKASVNEFVQAFRAQKPGTTNFFLKKPYATPSGSFEHMWVEATGEENGVFKGIVSNDAEETRLVKSGQQVTVKTNEVSDWKYEDGKKLIGGFTIRYFLERKSKAEREAYLKESGLEL